MALTLRTKTETFSIPYREDNDDPNSEVLAEFIVKPITAFDLNKMIEKCRIIEWDAPNKRTKKERFVETDYGKVAELRVIETLVDWKHVIDPDGNPLKCNKENKELFFRHNPKISKYVMDKMDEFMGLENDNYKEEEENL